MALVSVIIPTYNRSVLVREAIESVLKQSFTDFEIIVVDDGSTDDTGFVVRSIPEDRVKYIYRNNGGAPNAINFGLKSSQGQYVAFLESDDLWPESFLSTMLSSLEDNPDYGGAYSLFKNRYFDGREVIAFGRDRYMSGWLTKQYFQRTPFIIPSATLFHRSVWENFRWDESLRSCYDIDAFMRLSARTMFLCVPEVCIVRRISSDSLTIQDDVNLSPKAILIYERFYFHLGGDKIVPCRVADRWFNRLYRGMAKAHYRSGNRAAAIRLFKKAISYYPFDQHDYRGLLRSLLLKKQADSMPDWQMPESLPPYITVAQKP